MKWQPVFVHCTSGAAYLEHDKSFSLAVYNLIYHVNKYSLPEVKLWR